MRHRGLAPLLIVAIPVALGAAWQGPGGQGTLVPSPPAKAARTARVPRPAARESSAFQLFGSYRSGVDLQVNRVQCGINATGQQCVIVYNAEWGGGYWPKQTPDQYIYNGGLQVAAIIPGSRALFGWAGDTVGAYFFDARGDQTVGQGVEGVYDSRIAEDLDQWPSAAYVRDTTLFDASLIGRKAASEEDSWARYWDGNIQLMTGRTHPMGVLVDQRTLAWNRPEANRDIIYVLMRLINVTARDRSRYTGLAAYGYTPADIDTIARIGERFHAGADSLGASVPDTGFTWTNLYAGIGQDPDVVAGGGSNYSTVVLPFAMALAYKSDFLAPGWYYPPDIFLPPFATAPGFVGTKLLRAANGPVTGTSAVRMFTNTTGGGFFPDRFGVQALWRMLSNHILPIDGQCNAPLGTPLCALVQAPQDARIYLSTGPWPDVAAGQSVAFVIAYVFAAPLAVALQTDGRGHGLGSAAFDLKPGIPGSGAGLAAGTDTVRQIERVAGWTSASDLDADGDIEQAEVRSQPYTLLGKAAAAQALADGKFLLPSPPAAPRFYALPGDGKVTVVWERSVTELTGDPYFAIAANPLSGAYDPNFRQLDVEGYRVWRGTSRSAMQLVAQFDYRGTAIVDHTGQVFGAYEQVGQCAPDLGVVTGCRADFLHGQSLSVPIAGPVLQVPPMSRVRLDDGRVLVVRADTLITGGGSGLPAPQDAGVPFAFVDGGLVNGTTYVYAVTAFDVNSINSGASSYQSELVGKAVTPRIASSNVHGATLETEMYGGDGTRLDTDTTFPAINAADGTFAGPIPPANSGHLDLMRAVQELLPIGQFSLRVDSVSPGFAQGSGLGALPKLYLSVLDSASVLRDSIEIPAPSRLDEYWSTYEYVGPLVPYDSAQLRRFGVRFAPDARMQVAFTGQAPSLGTTSIGVARAAFNYYASGNATRWLSHSRWFVEGGHEPPNPTIDPFGSAAHTNGALTNVTAIYSPLPYRLPVGGGAGRQGIPTGGYRNLLPAAAAAWYPADFVVRWGSDGQVSVRDSTHRTDLPYKAAVQPGYGFLNASALVAAGVTSGQLSDGSSGVTFDPSVVSYYSLKTVLPMCGVGGSIAPCVALQPAAQLQPVDITNDGVSDGTGIALLVNGEPFYMLMSALPAAGTAWHLRAVGGGSMSADCSPSLPTQSNDEMLPGTQPTTCSGYSYTPPFTRPAYAPGLRFSVTVTRQFGADTASGDLSAIHTVPDPLYFTPLRGGYPEIRFVNLPDRAIVRIYTASGILVTLLTHNDQTQGGELVWDVTNRGGRFVASGVYFYHVETPDGRRKIGRFTIVQQAWPR